MTEKLRPFKVSAANNLPSLLKSRWFIAALVMAVLGVTLYSTRSYLPSISEKTLETNLSPASAPKTNVPELAPADQAQTEVESARLKAIEASKPSPDDRMIEILDRLSEQKQDIEKLNDHIQAIEDKLNILKPMVSAAVTNKKTLDKREPLKTGFDISKLGLVSIAEKSMTILFNGSNKVIKPGQIIAGDVVFLSYDAQTKQLKTSSGNYFVEQ